ncbi:MAG: hypothetical protein CL902_01060 [Dehalococcoidia bacterium]|nr:hypothetical protein [Dehalococcoidia bacterium]
MPSVSVVIVTDCDCSPVEEPTCGRCQGTALISVERQKVSVSWETWFRWTFLEVPREFTMTEMGSKHRWLFE